MDKVVSGFILRLASCLLIAAFAVSPSSLPPSQTSDDEAVWAREQEHFLLDGNNDPKGHELLHKDYIGWPSSTPAPMREKQLADALDMRIKQGMKLRFSDFKRAGIQVVGNVAITYDWNTVEQFDKTGKPVDKRVIRFTRTWLKEPNGWQILGGMSMVESTVPER